MHLTAPAQRREQLWANHDDLHSLIGLRMSRWRSRPLRLPLSVEVFQHPGACTPSSLHPLCLYVPLARFLQVVLSVALVTRTGRGELRLFLLLFSFLRPQAFVLNCLPSSFACLLCLLSFYAALLSRQFVEANRMRVEGLLAAFPKLVADSGAGGKQHTYAETDSIRYVYAPLESSMYLVLITNRGSNIIEDLDTLRLLAKVISEQLSGMPITEEAVTGRAFELIFAFDEVISAGGYREVSEGRGWPRKVSRCLIALASSVFPLSLFSLLDR